MTKKRRKKTRNSISSETSRAASPIGDAGQSTNIIIKRETETPLSAPFSPQSHANHMMMSSYPAAANNGVIKSPMHPKQMKTELEDAIIDDDPVSQTMDKSDDDPIHTHILCKKVRQAQQTKGLWAQRALNLDQNPTVDDSLMRPPINNPLQRNNNYSAGDGIQKRPMPNASSQNGGEKDDVSTDIIIPRERVISICSLDKDALDDYLNGGDNSQDQEAELLKYFQSDENAQNMSVDAKQSVSVPESYHPPTDPNDYKVIKRIGNDKNISELRWYLQQNLQQQADAVALRPQLQQFRGPVADLKGEVMQGFASATLSKMSANARQALQPKRSTLVPSYLPGNTQILSIESPANPKQTANANNIPQSPNSRRKNFSFVPISPGPVSPSGSQLNITGPPAAKQTQFVSPRSASHRKSYKQNPTTSTNPVNSTQGHINNHPYGNMSATFTGHNTMAISAPPSPAPLLQMRHEQHMSQMQALQSEANDCNGKRITFDGNSAEVFGNRSQSAPLHCQIPIAKSQMYVNASSMSCTQSPVANDYSEYMDIVSSSSNDRLVKMEPGATDLTVSSSLMRSNMTINQHLSLLNIPDRESNTFLGNNMSRSVPSTPQPSHFFGNSGSTPMTMFDNSKSVPTTPLANGFCGTNTPFRYSPSEMNRDFLINGNTVEPTVCNNSMSAAFFGSSSQHSQDPSDQQNSNLSDRDLRIVTEDIDELSSFGDAADPIIGSDLLNHL